VWVGFDGRKKKFSFMLLGKDKGKDLQGKGTSGKPRHGRGKSSVAPPKRKEVGGNLTG